MSYITLMFAKYKKQPHSFIRFLLVGMLNTLVGLSMIFLLMNGFGQSYWVATFIGNGAGAVCSYLLNRTFTFQSSIPLLKGGGKFLFVILGCYFLSYSAAKELSDLIDSTLSFQPIFSEGDVAVLLGTSFYTVMNYFGQKYLVFK